MRIFHFRRMNLRLLIALGIIAILATAAYGFAASNTVGKSKAGDGGGVISGYKISAVSYRLDTSDPSLIAGVSFTTDAFAKTVAAQFVTGTWYPCTTTDTTAGTSWTCTAQATADEAPVKAQQNLRVVAAQ